jgi:hypothetical protein
VAFAVQFWRSIGLGQEPAAALDAALANSPAPIAQHIHRHW